MKLLLGILSFCYKMYVGFIFGCTLLLLYPFFLVVLSRKSWRRFSFPLNVFWSYLVRILTFVHVKRNRVQLPQGPIIILANHTSYFDIFLMYSLLPHHRFLFMGKSDILSYPLVKTFFKRLNIPVFRDDRLKAARSFIQAKQCVAEGWSIVIFPEGGIPDNVRPQMIPFKIGAFKLAKSASVPIISLTFLDNHHIFSDPSEILGPAHPGLSRVVFHDPISVDEVAARSETELMEYCFEKMAKPLRDRGWMI